MLEIEPGHSKALRTLRELYATAGDFAGLERLYARLGQQEELVDALLGIADRLEARVARLPLVERAAQLAQQRADAARDAAAAPALERARQVWERVLAIEPQHTAAATALAPIYARQEKWSRLIQVLEIELAAAPDLAARLAKIAQIRQLCEQKLASRTLAFTWTLRAFELEPTSDARSVGSFSRAARRRYDASSSGQSWSWIASSSRCCSASRSSGASAVTWR